MSWYEAGYSQGKGGIFIAFNKNCKKGKENKSVTCVILNVLATLCDVVSRVEKSYHNHFSRHLTNVLA